ncbi:hypothetical protein LHV56_11990 [Peribacillus frigoritolerans]|uniref:hypothetical protein n=1 Tax=Peribacillus frigoritolerans TaxID=450367 RepID=UPI0020797378|nr:hypothetical protein [Peribacillus frigoritolerans]USK82556.1 hypothetical protein LHV56_11990 [Peribacillus frigoritolerans]
MVPELDPKIIHDFRRKVHEYNDFIRLYFVDYKVQNNIEGKDIWSKICSCMDWLTVSVEGIEKPEKKSNMNLTSLKFTHFLVTIDMVVEAVNHLWLAIGQVNNVKQPYINDQSIFNGREFDRNYTDEKYFKEIRSWFGVHAVNGNEVELEGFSKGVRFFSSWSSNRLFNEEEFYIKLYSNNAIAEKKYGGTKKVKVDDLMKFVVLRYNTLTKLMDEIDLLYFEEKKRLQNTPIQHNPNDTEINQLQQLYQQAKDRKLTKEYYGYDIQDYISFLSCDLNEYKETDKQLVTKYLLDLKPIITAYYKIIQEVDGSEYEVFELLNMRSQTYVDNYYDFSKVLEYASEGSNFTSGIISLETLIEKGFLPDYCVNLPGPSLHLLIHAIDHELNRTHPRK